MLQETKNGTDTSLQHAEAYVKIMASKDVTQENARAFRLVQGFSNGNLQSVTYCNGRDMHEPTKLHLR